MKLSLEVLTPGKGEGKVIPITLSQFVIGRDPQCHLRPASAVISKRHCAVLVKGERAFIRDFESTNGTFVNEEPVKGERELHNGDALKVGPLMFNVRLETSLPVSKPTPAPASRPPTAGGGDEDAAALLLGLGDDDGGGSSPNKDSQGVPTGSTVMEIMSPLTGEAESNGKPEEKQEKKPQPSANTSSAAAAILQKYMRRPRG